MKRFCALKFTKLKGFISSYYGFTTKNLINFICFYNKKYIFICSILLVLLSFIRRLVLWYLYINRKQWCKKGSSLVVYLIIFGHREKFGLQTFDSRRR